MSSVRLGNTSYGQLDQVCFEAFEIGSLGRGVVAGAEWQHCDAFSVVRELRRVAPMFKGLKGLEAESAFLKKIYAEVRITAEARKDAV